jgi:hypothetical protein
MHADIAALAWLGAELQPKPAPMSNPGITVILALTCSSEHCV